MKKYLPIIIIVAVIIAAVIFFKMRSKKQKSTLANNNSSKGTTEEKKEESVLEKINPFKDSSGKSVNPFKDLAESVGITLGEEKKEDKTPVIATIPIIKTSGLKFGTNISNGSPEKSAITSASLIPKNLFTKPTTPVASLLVKKVPTEVSNGAKKCSKRNKKKGKCV